MVTPKLPWELESEILSRVPITSIKQLQLTCKRCAPLSW
ncbi:BnaCnng53140D [Brassica napus]|uniref:BnaCnng53140D protein n=1 Tax=Brassica napus TaxID=3708 RepID=A0A078JMM9_BRANA|nr:BnaCnng53140D [Brassica napus]